ncbi:Conserved_hypothetical protein [Hexamita inflata]|uniref:Uncharacterized protein n=1 Tax=Hexamita inflata TaxID=28002 RepID=A0AA86TG76_9EUKA|nr:Conserved hypothetical protein [Hexamita inflata]
MECVNSKSISYQFQPGQEEKFCQQINFNYLKGSVYEIASKIPVGYQNNVCYFQGQIYFQVFDQVFIICDADIQLVCQIPDYALLTSVYYGLPFPSQLFTLNNKLFVHNASRKLYEINTENNSLKKGRTEFFMQFFQFCDIVVALNNSYIYRVSLYSNLEFFNLCHIQQSKVLFNSGGVLLLVDCSENYFIFNMLDLVLISLSPEQKELFTEIQQILVPGLIGFKIKDEILKQIISEEFPKRVQQRQQQFYSQNICQTTFNKLVFGSDLQLVLKSQFEHIQYIFISTQNQISNKQDQINQGLQTALTLQNLFLNSFLQLNDQCQQ